MKSFCTVVTRSHLPQAGALAASLRAAGNAEPLQVLVADAERATLPPAPAGVSLVGFDELPDGLPPLIRYYFDAFELANALKPWLVTLLFARGASAVIYLDTDLLVTGTFEPVWNGFGEASVLLTPHLLAPPRLEQRWINEADVADMGYLNGGFSAWRRGATTDRMLAWLGSRLPVYGFCDRAHGMFVDQKLLPLLQQYFPGDVRVLHEPVLNVAFWNAHERQVERTAAGRWHIAGQPVIFFHLSGYLLSQPGLPCSYLTRDTNAAILQAAPWLGAVLTAYHEHVTRHQGDTAAAPYAFAKYQGVKLTPDLRRLLFATGRLDRSSRAYRRIVIRDALKRWKRRVVALLRRTDS